MQLIEPPRKERWNAGFVDTKNGVLMTIKSADGNAAIIMDLVYGEIDAKDRRQFRELCEGGLDHEELGDLIGLACAISRMSTERYELRRQQKATYKRARLGSGVTVVNAVEGWRVRWKDRKGHQHNDLFEEECEAETFAALVIEDPDWAEGEGRRLREQRQLLERRYRQAKKEAEAQRRQGERQAEKAPRAEERLRQRQAEKEARAEERLRERQRETPPSVETIPTPQRTQRKRSDSGGYEIRVTCTGRGWCVYWTDPEASNGVRRKTCKSEDHANQIAERLNAEIAKPKEQQQPLHVVAGLRRRTGEWPGVSVTDSGPSYQIRWRDPQTKVWRSKSGFATREEAEEAGRRKSAEIGGYKPVSKDAA